MTTLEILKAISAKQLENNQKQLERQKFAEERCAELNAQVVNDAWFLCHGDTVALTKEISISSAGIETDCPITPEFVNKLESALVEYYTKIDDLTDYL